MNPRAAYENPGSQLLTTFYIEGDLFGIEVLKVQEVTGKPSVISVPLAPQFVTGLINLRGQLATALGLRELFGISKKTSSDQMSVVCRMDGNLVSLIVDAIGDVVEADGKNYEPPPETIPNEIRKFVKGIYKMNDALLSVIDLEKIANQLSPAIDANENRPHKI